MQVNLLSLNDTAALDNRTGGVLFALQGGSFQPLLKHETQVLSERARPEDEKDSQTAAGASTCSADVIKEAERNVEGSSRAFRRQVAHEGGVEQFRQGREGARQALQAKDAASASRAPSAANVESQAEAAPKPGAKNTLATEPGSAKLPAAKSNTAGSAANSTGNRTAANPASTQSPSAAKLVPGSLSSAATSTGAPASSVAGRGLPAALTPVRAAAAVQVQAAARPGAAGGAKGSVQTPVASLSTRSPTRAGAFSATKAGASGAAESTDQTGNVERIVRLVAQRMRGERSHTVMRLDPPELGSLRLQMDLRGSALTLRIDTSTHVAHRLLTEDVDRLRHGLEASGVQLERVEVRAPTQGPAASEQGNPQQAGTEGQGQEGYEESDAEHPEEHGRDSHPVGSDDGATRGPDPEPATELLVNMVA